jgi:hypothetical protein
MTRTIRAHFDGLALVPDEPLDVVIQTPDLPGAKARVPVFADSEATLESKPAAIERIVSHRVSGINLPEEALDRESIYEDEGA